ncbi:MAG: hypothetical protein Q8R35_03970 [bacterium]|nr:hypothetical protein [bacterium]
MPIFEVIFDGGVLGRVEASSLLNLIESLMLRACRFALVSDRCPTGGGLHAHIRAERFDPVPEMRGDRAYYTAPIPRVGPVSYNFDPTHTVPPPVTFSEVADDA